MTDHLQAALQYAAENQPRFLNSLNELLKFPSISTDPSHAQDMQKAAQWISEYLQEIGMQKVQVMPTGGHPVVYGELLAGGPHAPTVLIYGHYDVQPAEPVALWQSDPFQPVVQGDDLVARGASDMKGQVLVTIAALESVLRTGALKVNIKWLVEGEEEIGSPSLPAFIKEHNELLACDFALNPDTGMIAANLPTITYGLRGLAYFELRVFGPAHDLHSGIYGGVVHNPAQALCELIAGMHDSQGKVTLPGFYDRVKMLDAEEVAELKRLPMDEAFYLKQTGAPALWGESDFSPVERVGTRPTLEVNGMISGFTGEGSKTVLPAWAMAKISCRLVPDQDPADIYCQMVEYLAAHAPADIRYEVIQLVGGPAAMSDRNSPWVKAMQRAMEAVWHKPPLFRREGGSVPVVVQFKQHLGVEAVNVGFGLPDDNVHGPNEKLHLPTWRHGIDTLIHFFLDLERSS